MNAINEWGNRGRALIASGLTIDALLPVAADLEQNETFRFCRMPFGLLNESATYQRLIYLVLQPVLGIKL